MKNASYMAADVLPVKLIQSLSVLEATKEGFIPPIHVQLIPTNKCNLKCSYCSCAKEDRDKEMSWSLFKKTVEQMNYAGTESVTITGGGEPTLHPLFSKMVHTLVKDKIKVGFVTNGLNLHNIDKKAINKAVWCRISHDDNRPFTEKYMMNLTSVVDACKKVDFAFSYVVTNKPDYKKMAKIVQFANDKNFTHVRLVSDLIGLNDVKFSEVQENVKALVDDSKVIYQGRKEPRKGTDCYICYLKPVISADGRIYTCCGVQYALKEPSRTFPDELCIGEVSDLLRITSLKSGKPFDGSICERCYYTDYNKVLSAMLEKVKHNEFV